MLKTCVLVPLVVVLFIGTASAQSPIALGLKGGPVAASMTGDTVNDTAVRPGLAMGGFATLWSDRLVSFQPELLYTGKGVRLNDGPDGVPLNIQLYYLEVPLLMRLSPLARHFDVFAGPALAFRTGTALSVRGANEAYNIDDLTRTFDIGITVGGAIRKGRSSIEVRLTEGLLNVVSANVLIPPARNRNMYFMYGFRF